MANPIWPAGLPQNPFATDGAAYVPVDNFIRTNMESGPPKVRRRFTAEYEDFSFTIIINRAQLATLMSFIDVTLKGTKAFDWIDFRTGLTATYRFKKKPSQQWYGGDGEWWTVSVELEKIP